MKYVREKFPGSLVGPFLCGNFTPLCDQEGGGDPRTFTLLYRVANMWWRQLNLNNILYGIPSGPGEDFRFALFNIFFTSFGCRGSRGSQFNDYKFEDSWVIDTKGNQHRYIHGNQHRYIHGNQHRYIHGNQHRIYPWEPA